MTSLKILSALAFSLCLSFQLSGHVGQSSPPTPTLEEIQEEISRQLSGEEVREEAEQVLNERIIYIIQNFDRTTEKIIIYKSEGLSDMAIADILNMDLYSVQVTLARVRNTMDQWNITIGTILDMIDPK